MKNNKTVEFYISDHFTGSMNITNGIFTAREAGSYRDKALNNIALS